MLVLDVFFFFKWFICNICYILIKVSLCLIIINILIFSKKHIPLTIYIYCKYREAHWCFLIVDIKKHSLFYNITEYCCASKRTGISMHKYIYIYYVKYITLPQIRIYNSGSAPSFRPFTNVEIFIVECLFGCWGGARTCPPRDVCIIVEIRIR